MPSAAGSRAFAPFDSDGNGVLTYEISGIFTRPGGGKR